MVDAYKNGTLVTLGATPTNHCFDAMYDNKNIIITHIYLFFQNV
jgi:hypothetical protein